MPTFRNYREQAQLSITEISRLANIDYKTAKKADNDIHSINRLKAIKLISVLSNKLGINLSIDTIDR